jgi:hypothetical protein
MLSPAGMSFQNDDLPTNNGAFGSNIHVNTHINMTRQTA